MLMVVRVADLAAGPQLRARHSPTTGAPPGTTSTGASRDFRAGVWMRTLLRDPAAGVMHSMIYFGFLVLFVATVILEIDHQLPDNLKFLHGDVYQAYAAVADVAGVVFLVGILWAIGRRYIQRPYRIRIKTKPEDAVILGTFLLIAVTGFMVEGFRIALIGRPSLREVVVRRLRALGPLATVGVSRRCATCTARCGSRTSPRSSPSS